MTGSKRQPESAGGRRVQCQHALAIFTLVPGVLLACDRAARSGPSEDSGTTPAAEAAAETSVAPPREVPGTAAGGAAPPAEGEAQSSGALAGYALGETDGLRRELPGRLAEVSGLAVTADGRFLAHNDERGEVFQIDPASGQTVKSFLLGENRVQGDFEGIAVAGQRVFLLASDGTLAEFEEGAADARVPFRQIETGLRDRCEFEGLEYDALTDALLLACKNPRGRELRDRLVVFAWSLRDNALAPEPRFSIPLAFLEAAGQNPELHPSGIALHPRTGTFLIVAAQDNLLIELGPEGDVLGVRELAGNRHPQAEGIAFFANGDMLISDERNGGGLVTVYRFRQQQ